MAAMVPGLVGITGAFGLLVTSLALWQRRHPMNPEAARKVLHAGMGLACLALPWLFDTPWPVLALAVGFAAGLACRTWCPPLGRLLGPVLDNVARPTVGELLFPVAVALTYAGAGGDRIAFAVPILVLALADSAAALVGRRLGTARYGGPGGKSLEGSTAFFATTLGCTIAPLCVDPELRAAQVLLVSLSVALLATLTEAVSRHGLDNLSVPLVTLLLVRTLPGLGLLPLVLVLAGSSALALLGIAAALHGRSDRKERPCLVWSPFRAPRSFPAGRALARWRL